MTEGGRDGERAGERDQTVQLMDKEIMRSCNPFSRRLTPLSRLQERRAARPSACMIARSVSTAFNTFFNTFKEKHNGSTARQFLNAATCQPFVPLRPCASEPFCTLKPSKTPHKQ
jgi:hypothetical protein